MMPPGPQERLTGVKKRPFASARTIGALILREMATTYGRSPGGYLWAVLEPIGGIAILSFVFSFAFRMPPIGISFPLFYATGVIPLGIYTESATKIASAIGYSRALLAYPSVTFLDAILARFLLHMLTESMVCYLIFGGIFLFLETHTVVDIPTIAGAILLAGVLGLGVGTLNCFLFVRFPVWQRVWPILMRPLFFISGVFNLFDALPETLRTWLWYNPMVHIIGLMRHGVYNNYDAAYVSVTYVMGISMASFTMGLLLLRKHKNSLLDR